jgi:hypothetical protein
MTFQPSSSGSPSLINYASVPFNQWGHRLDEMRTEGRETVRAQIFWGEHERMQGVRDFSKASRLRLEKYLQLAQERNLRVELSVGLPLGGNTFPEWALTFPTKALMFDSVWTGDATSLHLVRIPAIEQSALTDGLVDFIGELFSILGLYRQPEGPLVRVSLDLGVWSASLSLLNSPDFAAALGLRYERIEWLNQIFGTNFRDFKSVATPPALRVLTERRPWLAAFEYKWALQHAEAVLTKRIGELGEMHGLDDILENNPPFGVITPAPVSGDTEVLMDGTLLGESSLGTFPWAPDGYLKGAAVLTFRLGQYLEHHAKSEGVCFRVLPFQHALTLQSKAAAVVCGKYLSATHRNLLDAFVAAGGQLFFPFGLPQYDERMTHLEWAGPSADRVKQVNFNSNLNCIPRGPGRIWLPTAPFEFSEDLWERIKETLAFIRTEPAKEMK